MYGALIGLFPLPEVFATLYKIILFRGQLSGFLVICFQDKKLFDSLISDYQCLEHEIWISKVKNRHVNKYCFAILKVLIFF